MSGFSYSSIRWRRARARVLARDGHQCTVSRVLGGACSRGPLHVHHKRAVSEGGAPYDESNLGTTCSRHHPQWEALCRMLTRDEKPGPPRCRHEHRSEDARVACERRLAQRAVAA